MSTLSNVELVMRAKSVGVEPPTVEAMRHSLAAHRLSTDHAQSIPASTAFRRAAESLRKPAQEGKPGIATRVWKVTDGHRCQIDREVANGSMHRARLGIVDLVNDDRLDDYEVNDAAVLRELRAAYEVAKVTYTWGDVTAVVRSVLSPEAGAAGTYTLRDGVYCVPLVDDLCQATLNRLEAAIMGVDGALLRYQIPDSEAHQVEIRTAILADLMAAIEQHSEAIFAYTDRTDSRHIVNRQEQLNDLRRLVDRLNGLLGSLADELRTKIDGLINCCVVAEQQAHMAQGSVRRIVVAAR